MDQITDICASCGNELDIYSGDDGIAVPMMSVGAKGVISVAANIIPSDVQKMCRAALDGDFATVMLNQQKFITEHDKSYKAQLMGGTPKPVGGTVGGSAIDYTKLIADANARGDFTAVAYYTRLQEQNKTN